MPKLLGKQTDGFTLIELMIVIAIIAIVVAITVPNLTRSRMSANEANALKSLRTVSTAEANFQSAAILPDVNGMGMYGSLAQLGAQFPPFVDQVLATGTKAGYGYTVTFNGQAPGSPAYQATAIPMTPQLGNKAFYVDQTGMITFTSDGSVPDPTSSVVQ